MSSYPSLENTYVNKSMCTTKVTKQVSCNEKFSDVQHFWNFELGKIKYTLFSTFIASFQNQENNICSNGPYLLTSDDMRQN